MSFKCLPPKVRFEVSDKRNITLINDKTNKKVISDWSMVANIMCKYNEIVFKLFRKIKLPPSSGMSEVQRVRLSLRSCMIKVLSLYDSSFRESSSEIASSKACLARWHALETFKKKRQIRRNAGCRPPHLRHLQLKKQTFQGNSRSHNKTLRNWEPVPSVWGVLEVAQPQQS